MFTIPAPSLLHEVIDRFLALHEKDFKQNKEGKIVITREALPL